MKILERFSPESIRKIRNEIIEAEGCEVLFIGKIDEDGLIVDVHVGARGTEESVPALMSHMSRGDVVIHNHPTGGLKPSDADMSVASYIGNSGIGFFIVDNEVKRCNCLAEPILIPQRQNLDDSISKILLPGNAFSQIIDSYEYREPQKKMLDSVAKGFNENKICVLEAGTGVGKSMAYLIPALDWVRRNPDERVIISTATINLQQQLIEKDIPLAQKVLGTNEKAELVKGRGNYVCLRRLGEALDSQILFDEDMEEFNSISDWAKTSEDGSRSGLPYYPAANIWNQVCCETDGCIGLRCGDRERCFIIKLKKKAAAARILVVNHHLLFSDLAYRLDTGIGFDSAAVLPAFKKIVFDEAHNIEESATDFFSAVINKFYIFKTVSRLHTKMKGRSFGVSVNFNGMNVDENLISALPGLVHTVKEEADFLDAFALNLLMDTQTVRLKRDALTNLQEQMLVRISKLHEKVSELYDCLFAIVKCFDDEEREGASAAECNIILNRLQEIAGSCQLFLDIGKIDDRIFWIERQQTLKGDLFCIFHATPLSVASKLQKAVFEPFDSVICTSATLSVGGSFDYFFRLTGLRWIEEDRIISEILPSPFPYKKNALLAVPTDAPEPRPNETSEQQYLQYSISMIKQALKISEGKGMVLFTSYKMLNQVFIEVAPFLRASGITVFKQGDDERGRLLNKFKADIASVLFATDSFWEGVDTPGETLQMLIIAKLPFQVPTDPVIQARIENIEKNGGNAFMEVSIPSAATKLKQGFGRLIRKNDDRGVVLILDPRIATKPYGKIFLASLPDAARTIKPAAAVMADIEKFFAK